MMKYAGYIPVAVAFYAGMAPWHPIVVLVCALASAIIYMAARQKQARDQQVTGKFDLLADGAFLLAAQVLIMFMVYILAWFLMNKVA